MRGQVEPSRLNVHASKVLRGLLCYIFGFTELNIIYIFEIVRARNSYRKTNHKNLRGQYKRTPIVPRTSKPGVKQKCNTKSTPHMNSLDQEFDHKLLEVSNPN